MTDDEELLGQVIHRLRTSLAVIAGYSELGITRDDAAIKAEARDAIAAAVGDLTNGIDEVVLALELSDGTVTVSGARLELELPAG